MGPFLTGEDEYSPELNKEQALPMSWMASKAKQVTTMTEILATLLSLATAVYQINIHLFVGNI